MGVKLVNPFKSYTAMGKCCQTAGKTKGKETMGRRIENAWNWQIGANGSKNLCMRNAGASSKVFPNNGIMDNYQNLRMANFRKYEGVIKK